MNNIFRKRLKRRRILSGRIIYHGNPFSCFGEHLMRENREPKRYIPMEEKKVFIEEKERKGWFSRLKERIWT